MAVVGKLYGMGYQSFFNATIDWVNNDIKVMLTRNYVPDQDLHYNETHITGEVVGTGYTAGGMLIPTRTVSYSSANKRIELKGANVKWLNTTLEADHAIIYKDVGTSKILIAYVNFNQVVTTANEDFELVWSSFGVVTAGV